MRAQVLTLLRDHGPLSRIRLARSTGLSPTSITRTVNQLADEGIVVEGATLEQRGPGRPATALSIRSDAFSVIGVQLGVGFVRVGVVDLLGRVRQAVQFEYDAATTSPTAVIRLTGETILDLLETTGVEHEAVLGVGVAAPGPVDANGRLLLMPVNLHWRDVPLAELLEPIIDLPVTVVHNVGSMALAEATFGVARGLASVAFVYLRTGLGASLVLDGRTFGAGVHGAIELGHLPVVDDGLPCVCGSRGCLETLVSAPALASTLQRLGLQQTNAPLPLLWEVAQQRSDVADAVAEIIQHTSMALATVVNLLNPDLILLGGALGDLPDDFFTRITETTRQSVFPLVRSSMQIQRSSLGLDAGVIGGGTVALREYFYV